MGESKILFGFLLGIISSGLGAFIAHIFSERRDRRKEFNKAANEFRKAFIDVALHLQNDSIMEDEFEKKGIEIGQFLTYAYPKHLSAYIDFEENLNKCERDRLKLAWEEYIYPQKSEKDRKKAYGFEFDEYSIMEEEKAKKLALSKIEKIISFAKPHY